MYEREGHRGYQACEPAPPRRTPAGITVADLLARKDRLLQLEAGLGKGLVIVRKANDPMLYLERKAYLTALHDILGGVQDARVTLVKALWRLEQGK